MPGNRVRTHLFRHLRRLPVSKLERPHPRTFTFRHEATVAKRRPESEPRGLPSLERSREDRSRALRSGKARLGPPLPKYTWLWLGVVVTLTLTVYWWVSESELTEAKSSVMARQRQVELTLGTQLLPFLERAEAWTQGLGQGPVTPVAQKLDALDAVSTAPGVYLRLPQSAAADSASIRNAVGRSLHDGFTSCFFEDERELAPPAIRSCSKTEECGADETCTTRGCERLCYRASDCAPGLLCGATHRCIKPVEPYNMRLAYRAYRVLSPEWNDELQVAPDEITIRLLSNDLDKVEVSDAPLAIELLGRAQYFTLVLDEEPEEGLPEPLPKGRADERNEQLDERIQRVPHWARVAVWDLRSGELLFRDRLRAEGRLRTMGKVATDPHILAALRSQAHSCALAVEVQGRIQAARSASGSGKEASGQAAPEITAPNGQGAPPAAAPRPFRRSGAKMRPQSAGTSH